MKAFVLVKNGPASTAFKLQHFQDPKPIAGQVLVEVEAFGLNFADVMARLGLYQDAPPLPSVVGYDIVGRVLENKDDNSTLKVGDRVVGFCRFGGYSSKVCLPGMNLASVPEEWPAAAVTALAVQYCTAYYCAVEMVNLHPGDNVLIQAAAGGVGSALVHLARRKGCTIFGTAGSQEKLKYLTDIGVDYPINYRTQDFVKEVSKVLGGNKLDIAFDSIGGKTYAQSRKLLGFGGRIVAFGVASQNNARSKLGGLLGLAFQSGLFSPLELLMKTQGMIGVNMLYIADHKPATLKRCLSGVIELIKKGEIPMPLAEEFPQSGFIQAHEDLEHRRTIGKLAIRWEEDPENAK